MTLRSAAARSSAPGSSSRSAASTSTVARLRSSSSRSSWVVKRGLRRAAPAEHGHLLDRRRGERVEHVLRHVGRLELGGSAGEHPGDVQRDVADPDDDDRPDAGQRGLDPGPVGVGVAGVPGDQVGGGQAAGQVLALDAEVPVEGGAVGVDDGVDVPAQLVERDVARRSRRCRRTAPAGGRGVRCRVSRMARIFGWSGAMPCRTSPNGVGSRSIRSTATGTSSWRVSASAA